MGVITMANEARNFTIKSDEPFFIFDSHGEWHATLLNNCLWDARSDYIGFVRGANYDVYTAFGEWIGNLTQDGRIVRRRVTDRQTVLRVKKLPPSKPRIRPRAIAAARRSRYHFIDAEEFGRIQNVPDLKGI
jgi:hypothetical protein